MSTTVVLSIIGDSGRNRCMKQRHFQLAHEKCTRYLDQLLKHADRTERMLVILQSGGSSFMDHVAVQLFLDRCDGKDANVDWQLKLHLPCDLDLKTERFIGRSASQRRCADMLNDLHEQFSDVMEYDTRKQASPYGIPFLIPFEQLATILREHAARASCVSHSGFFARNRAVANTTHHLVACTSARGKKPHSGSGGTAYTWDYADARRVKRVHFCYRR